MSSQTIPLSPSDRSHASSIKSGVVTLRPQLSQYCLKLEKENKQLKDRCAELREEIANKNLYIIKLESQKLVFQGRKTNGQLSNGVHTVEINMLKQQLAQYSKKLAESKVQIQQLSSKTSAGSAVSTTLLASMQQDKDSLQQQLRETESNLQQTNDQKIKITSQFNKIKETNRKLQTECRQKSEKLEVFLQKLENDRVSLEQIKNQMKSSKTKYAQLMEAVENWSHEFNNYALID